MAGAARQSSALTSKAAESISARMPGVEVEVAKYAKKAGWFQWVSAGTTRGSTSAMIGSIGSPTSGGAVGRFAPIPGAVRCAGNNRRSNRRRHGRAAGTRPRSCHRAAARTRPSRRHVKAHPALHSASRRPARLATRSGSSKRPLNAATRSPRPTASNWNDTIRAIADEAAG